MPGGIRLLRRFAASHLPRAAGILAVLAPLAGCTGTPSGTLSAAALPAARISSPAWARPHVGGPIKHVIIVMQENRSFDDLFQGYPGADTQSYGYDSHGKKIKLQPIPLEAPYDMGHFLRDFIADYDGGKMDGFNTELTFGQHGPNPQYGYVPQAETALYFQMANQYVLADRMFTSHIDASFVSHQYIIAGQAQHAVDLPANQWGCDGPPNDDVPTLTKKRTDGPKELACFDYPTLGDELDAAGLTWRYYAASPIDYWSAYQAVSHIYNGPDWNYVIGPNTQFLTDVKAGMLPAVTWITPTCQNSDHGGCGGSTGPAWVASIVNAVGSSKFWDSSAIFVIWDEWGGWYDHVPPPYVDYDGLGFRVPLLIISPYAKANYVSHTQYEHGSILRFIENQYHLPQLAASDARANDPAADSFDFTQNPRRFKRFKTSAPPADPMYASPEFRPADAE